MRWNLVRLRPIMVTSKMYSNGVDPIGVWKPKLNEPAAPATKAITTMINQVNMKNISYAFIITLYCYFTLYFRSRR